MILLVLLIFFTTFPHSSLIYTTIFMIHFTFYIFLLSPFLSDFHFHFHFSIFSFNIISIIISFFVITLLLKLNLTCIPYLVYMYCNVYCMYSIYINPISHHSISIYMPCIHNNSPTHPLINP